MVFSWLEDGHLHRVDVIDPVIEQHGSKGIAHHPRIVLGLYLYASTVLEVDNLKLSIRDDQAISVPNSTETNLLKSSFCSTKTNGSLQVFPAWAFCWNKPHIGV